MKKITSAALLAIQLSWKTVLAMFLASVVLQIFYAFQELMPGGVPLQATLGYEMLLSGDIGRTGRHWMSMLLFFLIGTVGNGKSSKTVYTMNRLGLSENQMTLVFGGVFSGYFLLYWALQIALCYGLFIWYSRFTLVSSNTFMLACWRSEWLHTLLPLAEWWGWLRNVVLWLSYGFTAAFGSQILRRGKYPFAALVPPVLWIFIPTGRIGELGLDILLTVLLAAFTIGFFFSMRGGQEDEDL